ncbi:MAG: hypothetical protein DWQ37_09285 [Planctomycetota bacterium]|nr:MAG: hypothetical protein DWQ37_09285 [Planctomycetota bacterium]
MIGRENNLLVEAELQIETSSVEIRLRSAGKHAVVELSHFPAWPATKLIFSASSRHVASSAASMLRQFGLSVEVRIDGRRLLVLGQRSGLLRIFGIRNVLVSPRAFFRR